MALREQLTNGMKDALRSRDQVRLSTLRLILAAIKDRDIAARGEGDPEGLGDAQILDVLAKMVKQRQESIRIYEEAGRLELAEQERAEAEVIESYMPRRLDDAETKQAVGAAIADLGATGLRDMGRVMAALKAEYAGRMDFSRAGALVKAALSGKAGD